MSERLTLTASSAAHAAAANRPARTMPTTVTPPPRPAPSGRDSRGRLNLSARALKVTLDEAALVTETRAQELLDLDEALAKLAAQDARKSQIVELRHFGGLTVEETAEFLKLSRRTVEREWTAAKAWLYRELMPEET